MVGIERKGSAVVRKLRMVAVAMVGVLVLSACIETRATDTQVVTAPDAAATGFGRVFSFDDDRLAARALLDGEPVVYVFDDAGSGWEHTATITAPPTAGGGWGASVAVRGDVLAVATPGGLTTDPSEYGTVDVYDLVGSEWQPFTRLVGGSEFGRFADGVRIDGNRLMVFSGGTCDFVCSDGWTAGYRREGPTYVPSGGYSVAPDGTSASGGGRGAIAVPGWYDFDNNTYGDDSTLRVYGADGETLLYERRRYPDYGLLQPGYVDYFTNVGIYGDVLAYENCCEYDHGECCASESKIHVRRYDGTTYVPEASFDVTERSAGIKVLANDVILVADGSEEVWHTYARQDGTWQHSTDLAPPDGVAFVSRPAVAGNRIALRGDEAIHVLTVEAVDVSDG